MPLQSVSNELKVETLVAGKGEVAEIGKNVEVHYTGKLLNGSIFDSSVTRGEPFTFTIGKGQVIEGWDQGITGMRVGEKRLLTIPPDLAYGDSGAGSLIPPNATLVFEVELLNVSLPAILGEADEAALILARDANTIIIDIRREEEWKETGIIEGSHTITAFTKEGKLHYDFQKNFFALIRDRNTPILIYCRTGNRTGALGTALIDQAGFNDVTHLSDGIVGWKKAGLKLVRYNK